MPSALRTLSGTRRLFGLSATNSTAKACLAGGSGCAATGAVRDSFPVPKAQAKTVRIAKTASRIPRHLRNPNQDDNDTPPPSECETGEIMAAAIGGAGPNAGLAHFAISGRASTTGVGMVVARMMSYVLQIYLQQSRAVAGEISASAGRDPWSKPCADIYLGSAGMCKVLLRSQEKGFRESHLREITRTKTSNKQWPTASAAVQILPSMRKSFLNQNVAFCDGGAKLNSHP